jgi:hypothetical protein
MKVADRVTWAPALCAPPFPLSPVAWACVELCQGLQLLVAPAYIGPATRELIAKL